MTLTKALERVRYIFKEVTEAYYKDAEITDWLNEGNRDFHSEKGIADVWTTSVSDGSYIIGIDTGMVSLYYLKFIPDGTTEEEDINSNDYLLFRDFIKFTDSRTTGTLVWYGEKLPTDISGASDTFDIDASFEHALIEYAVAKGLEKDDNPNVSLPLAKYFSLKNSWEKKSMDKFNTNKMKVVKGW